MYVISYLVLHNIGIFYVDVIILQISYIIIIIPYYHLKCIKAGEIDE